MVGDAVRRYRGPEMTGGRKTLLVGAALLAALAHPVPALAFGEGLAAAMFTAGVALVPLVVIEVVLAFRWIRAASRLLRLLVVHLPVATVAGLFGFMAYADMRLDVRSPVALAGAVSIAVVVVLPLTGMLWLERRRSLAILSLLSGSLWGLVLLGLSALLRPH